MSGAGSLVDLDQQMMSNAKYGRHTNPLGGSAKNKMAKATKIYFNKFARYFGLQHKPSSGAERKK